MASVALNLLSHYENWKIEAINFEKEDEKLRSFTEYDSVFPQTAPLVLGGRGRRDPGFDAMSDFIASLRTNLTSIDKVSLKLISALNGENNHAIKIATHILHSYSYSHLFQICIHFKNF